MIAALWLAAFLNPKYLYLNYSRVSSALIALQITTTSNDADQMFENQCGPTVFKKSIMHSPLVVSKISPSRIDSQIETQRTVWFPGQSFGPLNISTQSPILKTSPSRENFSGVGDHSRLSSSPATPNIMNRSSLTQWGTCSPNTTSPAAPLQYQLSTLKSSPSAHVDSNSLGSYGNSVGRRRGMDEAIEALFASSPCVDDGSGDLGLGRLKRKTPKAFDAPEKNSSEYWKANAVSELDLERWTVNIRRWLHGTVLRRVVDEINAVNAKIANISEDASPLGSTTLSTLEQLAKGSYQHITTLPMLIKFLNLTKHQNYIVNRLQELARGHCLADFKWDAGSRSTSLPWKDYLPNDSLILLHIFSAYMDNLLPPDAKCFTDGVFSLLHLIRSPDKPDLKSKYNAQIYVTAVQPPMIKIVLDGTVYTFPQDRFNLYHGLLMFFHFYKTLDGNIRHISLGPSGLNVAWVFDKR
nr:transmembrane protein 209 [Hymenolepis microstoma]